ncbi:glycosyltransferase involved in cell wall biosynthesis [Nocardia tenerifensis]|uniref:Glycosyltransferase involved in cell wall biosynthesis n=1 Tax=Nocardia tenerifensis TaxID=228006 RepID=A0A318K071_9NOCA|nr:glycosyltransferase [Nocardia tenerifensis]PXX61667.1 glycosyltransferase involved in cell wall biosynthesis [Nocardia tenerifensis]
MTGGGARIALLASNRHPIRQPFAGGLEAHVWHLARALRARGHRVTLFAAAGSDPAAAEATLRVRTFSPSSAAAGDPSMAPAQFLADHHAYLTLMTELATHVPRSFDLIHNHSLHYLPLAMAPALDIPMLTTLHTPPTVWLESALEVNSGAGSDFVAVSEHTAAAWRRHLPDLDVIPNGIDVTGWPLGDGGHDLVWFGRITPEKGTHLAIEAARRAGRRLHLAGPVSDARYYRDTIAGLLDDDVIYHGHLDQRALGALVGSCGAALVTPLWDEPYGLVVAEALATGTPVVAFARGGIPEILDDDSGRLVPGGDVAAMAAAVDAAAALPRHLVRRRAETQCGHGAMVEAYLRRYRRLLSSFRAGPRQGAA